MLTLKQTLGIISLIAAVMACIVATLRPPSLTTELPGGFLFGLTILLVVVAISRLISAYPNPNRFWAGFLAVLAMCFALSFSSQVLSANTAPEHITRFLVRLRPLDSNVPVHASNRRFYAMERVVTNAAVLTLAVVGGLLAQQGRPKEPNENEHNG